LADLPPEMPSFRGVARAL